MDEFKDIDTAFQVILDVEFFVWVHVNLACRQKVNLRITAVSIAIEIILTSPYTTSTTLKATTTEEIEWSRSRTTHFRRQRQRTDILLSFRWRASPCRSVQRFSDLQGSAALFIHAFLSAFNVSLTSRRHCMLHRLQVSNCLTISLETTRDSSLTSFALPEVSIQLVLLCSLRHCGSRGFAPSS